MRLVHWRPYAIAIGAILVATAARLAMSPWLGEELPYPTYFAAVAIAGWFGGFIAGAWTTSLSGLTAAWLFLKPAWEGGRLRPGDVLGLALFVTIGGLITVLIDRLHRLREAQRLEAVRLATIIRSIGDGVIVTDERGCVAAVNPVAERLTGWSQAEAEGLPLPRVFRIVNEATRADVDNPAVRALEQGTVVGLANHTLLIARDGRERPIDDSAAPVTTADGRVNGSVLVFRDVSARREAEEALRRSEQELNDFFDN
ncbi:MAG: PAS domain S-box protein, partial [Vicinamibacterales bacterium]